MTEPHENASAPPGFADATARLGASLIALLSTRFALAAVEFAEQREKTKEMLSLIVVATVFLSFAVIAASILVLLLFWETHRHLALAGIIVFYVAIGIVALGLLKHRSAGGPPFAATLSELAKDVEWLKRGSEPRP